jgi:hypothetical protein
MNYVVGLRMTLKRSKLIENKDKISKKLFPEIRSKRYRDPFKKYSSQIEGEADFTQYSQGGTYKGRGGYSQFFPYNTKKSEALGYLTKLEGNWYDPQKTLSIIVEFMFYNINYDTIAYMAQGFLLEEAGVILNDRRWRTFNPNLYATGRNDAKLVFMYIFQILFQVMVLYEIIKMVMKFCYFAIDICTGKRVYIFFNDVVSIITIVFGLTCAIYWYKIRSTLQ